MEERDIWFPDDSLTAVFAEDQEPPAEVVWEESVNGYVWNEFSFQRRYGVISTLLSRYHYEGFGEEAYKEFKFICEAADCLMEERALVVRKLVYFWLQLFGKEYDLFPVPVKEQEIPEPKTFADKSRWFFFSCVDEYG